MRSVALFGVLGFVLRYRSDLRQVCGGVWAGVSGSLLELGGVDWCLVGAMVFAGGADHPDRAGVVFWNWM